MNDLGRLLELLRSGELESRYDGLVRVIRREDLALLNYTDRCQHERAWDDVTIHCRGLIVRPETGEVVARPFAKFFNWGEYTGPVPDEPIVVTEKLDGTLAILFVDRDGSPRVATRAAFDSPEARRGAALASCLREVGSVARATTLLFELVSPHGSPLVKYDVDELVLLGAVETSTGRDLDHPAVLEVANRLGCRTPRVHAFASIDEALAERATLPANQEGYVVRFASGLRLKVKSEAYLRALKAALGVTPSKVLAALASSGFEQLARETPEELRPDLERLAGTFRTRRDALEARARELFAVSPTGDDRKTFAAWVGARAPMALRPALFWLLDGREPDWWALVAREVESE